MVYKYSNAWPFGLSKRTITTGQPMPKGWHGCEQSALDYKNMREKLRYDEYLRLDKEAQDKLDKAENQLKDSIKYIKNSTTVSVYPDASADDDSNLRVYISLEVELEGKSFNHTYLRKVDIG